MKLFLTGEPCAQQRHCYFVRASSASFIVDCGYQRCYGRDALPHIAPEHIRESHYLFLTHSHENQSGALPYLLDKGFSGRVVMTTETARQLPFAVDDPLVLEGLSIPYSEVELPGGLGVTWGRSGHCSGSAWFRLREGEKSLFFSGDYYYHARIHACDPIVGMRADLAVLDCDYGTQSGHNTREELLSELTAAIAEALADGRPVLLPVPQYGRALGLLARINQDLPDADVFADGHFRRELSHLDAAGMWVRPEAGEMLSSIFVREIPDAFVALGVYFVSDPQLDSRYARELTHRLLVCGARVIMTGTVEPGTVAAQLMHSGQARMLRYGIHCTQEDMLRIASQNEFGRIIAYRSDYEPTQPAYEI